MMSLEKDRSDVVVMSCTESQCIVRVMLRREGWSDVRVMSWREV